MPRLKAFHRPDSLAEAFSLLEKLGDRAKPLGGGTALMFSKTSTLEELVDLSRLGLDAIHQDAHTLRLGAMVRVNGLRAYLQGQKAESALLDAADTLYSRIVQHHVTIGGNCVMVYGWSHLPVVTWCLQARFVLQRGGDRKRTLVADDYYARHPTKLLEPGELLVEVQIPEPMKGEGSAYKKFGRDTTDEGLASIAARLHIEDGTISAANLVVGRVRPMPQRMVDAEKLLLGQAPDATSFSRAAESVQRAAQVEDNYMGSGDYRRHILSVLVQDALAEAARRAVGGAA